VSEKSQEVVVEFAESPIPDGTLMRLDEVTIRGFGRIWRVHQNDSDPFPSKPHAHNLETGLRVHLGTGQLYCGTVDTGKNIGQKHLTFLRSELVRKGIDLPPSS
jgi:hypothetical protein